MSYPFEKTYFVLLDNYCADNHVDDIRRMKMTKVSVLIPVYNQRELVVRAIESIPERDDINIFVFDDCSTDGSYAVVEEYFRAKKRDFYGGWTIPNGGVAYSMNQLYDMANGEYVVALGSDDYLLPDFEKVIDELDGTDLVYFDLETNDGTIFHLTEETKRDYCGSVKFIRREFLGDTRCPEDKKAGEDRVFYEELLKKNPTEKFTGIVAKHYNFPREGSLSWQLREGIIKEEK